MLTGTEILQCRFQRDGTYHVRRDQQVESEQQAPTDHVLEALDPFGNTVGAHAANADHERRHHRDHDDRNGHDLDPLGDVVRNLPAADLEL